MSDETDIVQLGVAVDTTDLEKTVVSLDNTAKSAEGTADAVDRLGKSSTGSFSDLSKASSVAEQQMQALASSTTAMSGAMSQAATMTRQSGQATLDAQNKTMTFTRAQIDAANATASNSKALHTMSSDVERLMARYDPLGAKLRQLTLEQMAFTKAMGDSTRSDVMATFQGLEADIEKTAKLMNNAGVEVEGTSKKMVGLGLNSQLARRELMMMGREIVTGDFSRLPITVGSLVAHSNLLNLAMSGIGLTVVGVTAAIGGLTWAIVAGHSEMEKMNSALQTTSNFAGMTRGSMDELAVSMSRNGVVTVNTARDIITALVASGRIGSSAIQEVSRLSSDFARATGADIAKIAPEMIKLFSDPLAGAEELNKVMHFLTATDIEHIATLMRLGEVQQAQLLLANDVREHLSKEELNVGYLTAAYRGLRGAIADMISGAKEWGKDSTAQSAITATQAAIANLEKYGSKADQAGIAALKEQLALFKKGASAQALLATGAGEVTAALDKQNMAQREINKSSTHQVEMLRDTIKLVQSAPDSIDKTQRLLELNKQIANLQNKGAKGSKATEDRWNEELAITKAALDAEKSQYDASLKMLDTYHSKMGMSDDAYYKGRAVAIEEYRAALKQSEQDQQDAIADKATPKNQAQIDRQLTELHLAFAKLYSGLDQLSEQDALSRIANFQKVVDAAVKGVTSQGKKEIDAVDKATEAQRRHNEELGKTPEQIDRIRAARSEESIASNEAELAALQYVLAQREGDTDFLNLAPEIVAAYKERVKVLNELIAKQKILRGEQLEGAAVEARVKNEKDVAKVQQDGWKETDRIVREAFMSWGENGKSMAETIGASLRKALLSAIYEATIRPIALQIYTSLTGGSVGGSTLGTLGNAASLFSIGKAATGSTTLASLGSAFSSGFSSGAAGLTPLIATNATTGAAIGGATQAATSAGSALGSLGYAGLIGLAVVAAYAIFHKDFISAESTSNSSTRYDPQGKVVSRHTDAPEVDSAPANKTVDALAASYLTLAHALGIGTITTEFGYGGNTGEEGKNPNFTLGVNAGSTHYMAHEVALTDANVQLEASRAVLTALEASTLPKYLSGVFDNLVPSELTQQQIDDVLTLAQSFADLHTQLQGLPFEALKDMSYATAAALVAASGGMEQFGTNLGTFYSKFYSPQEQTKQTNTNIATALTGAGRATSEADVVAMTRDEWRGAVEASMRDTSEAGIKMTATLLSLSDAFDSTHPALAAAKDITQEFNRAMLVASGNSSGLAAFDQAVSDAALITAGWSQDQVNQVHAAEATAKATEATTKVANATNDFNRAMLEASGNSSGLAAFDQAVSDAALITSGWSQAQVDALHGAQATAKAALVTNEYNRALLEAAGDSAGLAKFDKAISDAALIASGWTQDMIDSRDAVVANTQALRAAADAAARFASQVSLAQQVQIDLGVTTPRALEESAAWAAWDKFKTALPAGAGMTVAEIAAIAANPAAHPEFTDATWATINEFLTAAHHWLQFDANNQPTTSYSPVDNSAADAAAEVARAWKDATDSIVEEIKRIQDSMVGEGPEGYAQATMKFYTAVAQAKAGDLTAAQSLPDLSQRMLTLAESNAHTLAEFRRAQASTIGALASVAGYGLTSPNADVVAELRDVKVLLSRIAGTTQETAEHTLASRKTLTNVTNGGSGMNLDTPVLAL